MTTLARSSFLHSSKIRPLGSLNCRYFTTTSLLCTGHNKWSKIKHDKAKEDAGKAKQRSATTHQIASFSKLYGSDPESNPQLAAVVATAKKQGVPKATIENAIARGQGISPKGTALENLTIEAMIPPSVATIIECQTDSKLKTLADIRHLIKYFGGSITPTTHFFQRRGRLVLRRVEGLSETEIFDQAIEAHATDVQVEEDGNILVYTEPNQIAATAQTLSRKLGLEVRSSDLVWDPKEETKVEIGSTDVIDAFLDRIQDDPAVQGIYLNTSQP